MTTVIGIDADVHRLAYATVRGDCVLAVQTIERANSRGRVHERYDANLKALMRRASDPDVAAVVYLEDIFLSDRRESNVRAFKELAVVQGEILYAARQVGVPVERVGASVWRAEVLGFTREREKLKQAAVEFARGFWPVESDHEADALCLAMYGSHAACE